MSMGVRVTSDKDVVSTYLEFSDSAGIKSGTHTLVFTRPRGSFFGEDCSCTCPGLWYRDPTPTLLRFMSLLPNCAKYPFCDKADQSSVTNARFTSLQLYDWAAKSFRVWDTSRIEYAWHSETANVPTLSISPANAPSTDTFSCRQQVQYL